MINENTSGLGKVFLCGEREIFEGFISNKPMELPNLRFLKESPDPQIELVNATGYYFSTFVETFGDFYNSSILKRAPENQCEPVIYESCVISLKDFLFFYDQGRYERNPKFDAEAKQYVPYPIRGESRVLNDGYRIEIQGTCYLNSNFGPYIISFFSKPLPILRKVVISLKSCKDECSDFSHTFDTIGIQPGLFQAHKINLD